MAGIPPRTRSRSSNASWKERSPLEILLHMGFSKERAEKALAVTGNNGVHIASDWLLSHVNDPHLDDLEAQEYIIYLCPCGDFLKRLGIYWETSMQSCGWNSAHIYHPHITLCSFFKLPNNKVSVIDSVITCIKQELLQWPALGTFKLELFTQSKNFIGYFVLSPYHQFIEKLMIRVHHEFSKAGIEMKPQMKQLHMTLAFQYDQINHDVLMKLAQELTVPLQTEWEIKVFSRNPALKSSEVRKIIKRYKPQQDDELELQEGDYVHMDPEEHERSPDGWFKGTSWRTGVSGFFPGNFTTRCSQMDIWTVHRSASLPATSSGNVQVDVHERNLDSGILNGIGDYDNLWVASSNGTAEGEQMYAKVKKPPKNFGSEPRRLFVVRHAERCDFAFKNWFERCFDAKNVYTRFNLNCPKQMIPRANCKDFIKDCPLTVIGREQARLTGEALRETGQSISYIYCSPALRCVETAQEIMTAYGSHVKMCIEPSLFEWLGWYKPILPIFMTPEELEVNGFAVDSSYTPYVQFESIPMTESVGEYYRRSHSFVNSVLKKHKVAGGNILLVAHSGSLDACTRQLRGKAVRNQEEFRNIVKGCPYCCLCMAVEDFSSSKWNLAEPPIPQLTHGTNKEYKWDLLMS
ncbi:protein UBASH3A [Biomphalaria pfeifferi]|uniref:Protein UBASH3A n=1 Tax=Biomphalaria pfeifferi TaxID=112525 RepID=A0AAD8BRQ7_BIOPF|nr:protein UBASH3A [Biomphalaria pfeifferi]